MLKKFRYIVPVAFALLTAGAFVGCDDDDTQADEWTSAYVYLQRPSLGVEGQVVNMTHSSLGVSGGDDIAMPVTVALSKTSNHAVTVRLTAAVEGAIPASDVAFAEGSDVVIPAGESTVTTTLTVNSDWSFAGKNAETYKVKVGIGEVAPQGDNLRVSTKQKALTLEINKAAYADMLANVTPDGTQITDYTGWSCWVTNEDDNNADWIAKSELTDGNRTNYIWFNTPHLGIKVDMGEVKTLSGIGSYCYFGSYYNLSSCSIYTSEDGETWNLITPEGRLAMDQSQTMSYVKFIVPVRARYFIWHMYGGCPLSSELYIYQR